MARRRLTKLVPGQPVDPNEYVRVRIQVLTDVYRDSQKRLVSALTDPNLSDVARARIESLLRQVREEIRRLNATAKDFADNISLDAYKRGLEINNQLAPRYGITARVDEFSRIHTNAVNIISKQIADDLFRANGQILQTANQLIRPTQLAAGVDTLISRNVAAGLVEGSTRVQISKGIIDTLRDQVTDGQFVQVGGRRFTLEDYANLVARTRTREATAQGTINGAAQVGMDLVQIDVHGDACPQCQLRMGRVYSISGTSADFPPLDAKPPYHPNCECNIFPVSALILKRRGQYDKVVELSNMPVFTNEKDAKEYLEQFPEAGIKSFFDYQAFIRGDKRAA